MIQMTITYCSYCRHPVDQCSHNPPPDKTYDVDVPEVSKDGGATGDTAPNGVGWPKLGYCNNHNSSLA